VGGDPADYQVIRHMAFQTGQPGNLMVSARLNARGTRQKGLAIGQNQSPLVLRTGRVYPGYPTLPGLRVGYG